MPVKSWFGKLTPNTEADDPIAKAVEAQRSQDMRRNGWNLSGKGASNQFAKMTATGGAANAGFGPPPTKRKV